MGGSVSPVSRRTAHQGFNVPVMRIAVSLQQVCLFVGVWCVQYYVFWTKWQNIFLHSRRAYQSRVCNTVRVEKYNFGYVFYCYIVMYWYIIVSNSLSLSLFGFSLPPLVSAAGQSTTIKGCATQSVCSGAFSQELDSVAVELTCCEGDLCNSAWSATHSVLFLLWPLGSVLLFHWAGFISGWLLCLEMGCYFQHKLVNGC